VKDEEAPQTGNEGEPLSGEKKPNHKWSRSEGKKEIIAKQKERKGRGNSRKKPVSGQNKRVPKQITRNFIPSIEMNFRCASSLQILVTVRSN
jgi:hypothetical protein